VICLGSDWLAASTDQRIVRVFSVTGIQLQLFSVAGPVVSMSASDNKLMIVYHNGIGLYSDYVHILGFLLANFSPRGLHGTSTCHIQPTQASFP